MSARYPFRTRIARIDHNNIQQKSRKVNRRGKACGPATNNKAVDDRLRLMGDHGEAARLSDDSYGQEIPQDRPTLHGQSVEFRRG